MNINDRVLIKNVKGFVNVTIRLLSSIANNK